MCEFTKKLAKSIKIVRTNFQIDLYENEHKKCTLNYIINPTCNWLFLNHKKSHKNFTSLMAFFYCNSNTTSFFQLLLKLLQQYF